MVKLKTNLAEFSAEGYGSKIVVFPMTIMIMEKIYICFQYDSFLASSTKSALKLHMG
jgi:hypothetical protein